MEIIKKGAPQYKANLHCHSTRSDGRLAPETLKDAYKAEGYSVLAITDHERPTDHTALSDPDFVMLTGYEAYIRTTGSYAFDRFAPEIHINLFARDPHNTAYVCYTDAYCNYEKDPEARAAYKKVGSSEPRRYDVDYVNAFVKSAKENGYICSHNHAFWSLESYDYLKGYEGFFSMEIYNNSANLINGTEYNAQLYDHLLRDGKRLFCHAADDNHNAAPFGSPGCDSFGGFTMIMADELSYSSVFDALERGSFYASMGPKFHSITIENGKIRIECDPVRQLTVFLGGKATLRAHGSKESPVCFAEFDMPEKYLYLRFDAIDFEGKHANTRAYFEEEINDANT